MTEFRLEKDSMGTVHVPLDALYGAQTQRAINNFSIGDMRMPPRFICSLGLIKAAAALANTELGQLDEDIAQAIAKASMQIATGMYHEQFPVDVFQTGSGTSSNMNINEVVATLASRELGQAIHANDHVNCGQSSNDVIPTAIHLSAYLALDDDLLPALRHIQSTIAEREKAMTQQIKTGRTHLMDAMPLSFSQELSGWRAQLKLAEQRIIDTQQRLKQLAQGGTAIGTGVNTAKTFPTLFASKLSELTNTLFEPSENFFASISSQDTAVELSGQLKTLAVSLIKISNDLRWMNSGPLTSLGEITLKALQPGSSIMPGKVNPVIPEAVAMAATQVIGNDTVVTLAGQSGNFQLNVMLPLIAHNVLQSISLLTHSCLALADTAIKDFSVNTDVIEQHLARNPILVTALNQTIGYSKAAVIAKRAYEERRPILDVAKEMTDLSDSQLAEFLDPKRLI